MTSETVSQAKRPPDTALKKTGVYLFWTGVGLAIIVALFSASGVSLADLGTIVLAVPLWFYALLAGLQAIILLLASLKWRIILGQLPVGGRVLPLGDALAGTSLGALAGQVLPIQLVTPIVRAWVARPHQISAARAMGTSVFEQVFEVVVLLSMGLISALVLVGQFGPAWSGFAALAAGLAVVFLISPVFRILRLFTLWASGHLPAGIANVSAALATALQQAASFPQKILFQLTALSFLRYLGMLTVNVWTIAILYPNADIVFLALAYPTILLVMSLPFIPGGLGIVEVTWTGVLIAQGMPPAQAVQVALSLRLVSTIAFLAIVPLLVMFRTNATVPE